MKTKFFFKFVGLIILFLILGCRNEIEPINQQKSANAEYRDPKAKTLKEINNSDLNSHLPKTALNVRNILEEYFKNEKQKGIFDKSKIEIDTLNIYELSKNSYLFNIKNLNINENFYPYLVSLELVYNSDKSFSNKLSIFKNSQTDVLEFDNKGKIIKKSKKESKSITARGGCSCSSSSWLDFLSPVYSGTDTPGGITSFYAGGGAPLAVVLQFAQQTGNFSLAASMGYIMYTIQPCTQDFCMHYYNPPVTANHTTSDLSIPNPNDNTFIPFNSYYTYPFSSNLKDLITNYYSKVYVPQINSFITSSNTTYNDHIKKQTFINSFFYWLYDLNSKNNQLFQNLINNPNALEKVFNLFADLNINNTENVFIGSPFPEGNLINIISTHLFSDTTIFQQYVNNQITKDQFISYYNNALDFTNSLSGYQKYWIDQNWQDFNIILTNILSDYTNKKTVGLWVLDFFMQNQDTVNKSQIFTRINALQNTLNTNKDFLINIPCSELPSWNSLANYQIPQVVKDRVNQVNSQTNFFESASIQSVFTGGGPSVNMDYFPIKINSLPNKPGTNQKFTPSEFFDYFRKNINNFVYGSSFTPVINNTYGINDTTLWNSSNPLTSFIHIDIPGNDGTVICSGYNSNFWIFTTVDIPWDDEHPVSGNRMFGFYMDGSTMYVFSRGVDRFTFNFINYSATWFAEGIGFNKADDLWSSFQTKVSQFVNNNGGQSTIPQAIKYRPSWINVRDYIKGNKPLSSLGCY